MRWIKINFYEKVIGLCQQKGVSRSKMADDIGISRSTPKEWADKNSTPQFSIVKKYLNTLMFRFRISPMTVVQTLTTP